MPASPSSVLTRGLGSWGSVNLLLTRGLGSSNVVVTDTAPICGRMTLRTAVTGYMSVDESIEGQMTTERAVKGYMETNSCQ